jgi:hypothetical protein
VAIPVRLQVQPSPEAPHVSPELWQTGPVEAFLVDLSEFGIGLLSHTSLPWGVLVELEFQRSALPHPYWNPPKGTMKILGRVVHSTPYAGQFRIGISFTRMEESDRNLIRRLLSAQPAPSAQERRRSPRISLLQIAEAS